MSESPRVSVLMTVYDAAPWLREAVESLINQTYSDWELVVIENGSSDESPGILASYSDPRIRVCATRENMGRTPALRRALELARGEYIAVLDADDVAEATRLERQVAFLDAYPEISLVGSWTRRIDGEGRAIGEWTPPVDPSQLRDLLGFANPIVHSAAMYRAESARLVGGYPIEYPYAQDYALWLRLAERAPIAVIGEYLSRHRSQHGSMTVNKASAVIVSRDKLALLEYASRHLALSAPARRRNREERTIAACRYAIALVRTRRIAAGLGILLRAVVGNPSAIVWNRVYRETLFG
jgi:glycosyltransferase involved in cell wall biosynthesis